MMNKEVEYLKEHLYEIYKYKKSMKNLTYDMDIGHLLRACKALDYSQKEIDRLNNLNKQLEKENKELKQPQVYIDCENMEERYGRDLYEDYLKEKIEQLENIRKEAIEFTNSHFKQMVADEEAQVLLNILNKGE